MWPDDAYWLPLFLQKKRFRGTFSFDKDGRIHTKEVSESQ